MREIEYESFGDEQKLSYLPGIIIITIYSFLFSVGRTAEASTYFSFETSTTYRRTSVIYDFAVNVPHYLPIVFTLRFQPPDPQEANMTISIGEGIRIKESFKPTYTITRRLNFTKMKMNVVIDGDISSCSGVLISARTASLQYALSTLLALTVLSVELVMERRMLQVVLNVVFVALQFSERFKDIGLALQVFAASAYLKQDFLMLFSVAYFLLVLFHCFKALIATVAFHCLVYYLTRMLSNRRQTINRWFVFYSVYLCLSGCNNYGVASFLAAAPSLILLS